MFGRNKSSETSTRSNSFNAPEQKTPEVRSVQEVVDSYSRLSDGRYAHTKTYRPGEDVFLYDPDSAMQHERCLVAMNGNAIHVVIVGRGYINGKPQQGIKQYTVPLTQEDGQRKITASDFTPLSKATDFSIGVPEGGLVKEVMTDGGEYDALSPEDYAETARIDEVMTTMTPEQRNEMHVFAFAMDAVYEYEQANRSSVAA
jgi:hypothetical protein